MQDNHGNNRKECNGFDVWPMIYIILIIFSLFLGNYLVGCIEEIRSDEVQQL